MSARDHRGHPKLTNQEILQYSNTTKRRTQNVIMNWGESQPIAILRSSDSRGRHPRRAPPWIGHAIRHVCEWTHWKWMVGLCRGARFISSNKNAPNRATPSPPGGRGLESSWRIACAGEWVDELCVLGCARDWVCASPSKSACRDGGKKNTSATPEEKQNWCKRRLLWWSFAFEWGGSSLKKKMNMGEIFLFWIIVKLVLIDTGRCSGHVWRSSAFK